MSVADYAHSLRKLLPSGRAWEFVTSPGNFVWDTLLTALGTEPQRIEDDAYLLLHKTIPDNADTDLDLWESVVGVPDEELTDAERLARIRAILYGPPDVNLESLQTVARLYANDENVILYNRAYAPCVAGSNVGDSVASGAWDHSWLLELYPSLFAGDPDSFTGWTGFVSFANAVDQSPVTLLQTADSATLPSASEVTCDLLTVEDDDEVYLSIWIRAVADFTFEFGIIDRAGVEQSDTFALKADQWCKVCTTQPAGTGASDVQAFMRAVGSDSDCHISWIVGAITDQPLVDRISALFPIHTRGLVAVQGEYATLLAHEDQLEVCY